MLKPQKIPKYPKKNCEGNQIESKKEGNKNQIKETISGGGLKIFS